MTTARSYAAESAIRLRVHHGERQCDLAAEYGVDESTISQIVRAIPRSCAVCHARFFARRHSGDRPVPQFCSRVCVARGRAAKGEGDAYVAPIKPRLYTRDCSCCGRRYTGPTRLLCATCFVQAGTYSPIASTGSWLGGQASSARRCRT